jgi:hypothetical protein
LGWLYEEVENIQYFLYMNAVDFLTCILLVDVGVL